MLGEKFQLRRIAGVSERDIDLLLLEEFVATPRFARWFVQSTGGSDDVAEVIDARRSVTQSDGESDLEITLRLETGRDLRLLIENKINANLQPQQAERYQSRGETYRARNLCSSFRTVLVAPRLYFGAPLSSRGFHATLAYEEIRDWFGTSNLGVRAAYKVALLTAAIEKGVRTALSDEDDAVTQFWLQYWAHVSQHHPEWLMPKPAAKPAGSTFIQLHPSDLPPGVNLLHKLSTGHADLQFSNYASRLDELHHRFRSVLDSDMLIDRATKSGVIRIKVPPVNVARPFEEQLPDVAVGIAALKRLHQWFRQHWVTAHV